MQPLDKKIMEITDDPNTLNTPKNTSLGKNLGKKNTTILMCLVHPKEFQYFFVFLYPKIKIILKSGKNSDYQRHKTKI